MGKVDVLFDHQAFEMQRFGGISRYFCELIKGLSVPHDLALRVSTNYYLHEDRNMFPQGLYLPERLYKWLKGPVKKVNRMGSMRKLLDREFSVFHPTYYHPYFLPYLEGRPYVVTVHDMTHELFSHLLGRAEQMIAWKKQVIGNASRVIAISENTKRDIISLLGVAEEKIDVIYHGIDQEKRVCRSMCLPERYVLYVGDRGGYKNFDILLGAFRRLSVDDSNLYLICTGKAFKSHEWSRIEQSGLARRVLCFRAGELELKQLYQQALVFVYPSLYEGFGLPILEAYVNECPVALSRASCFPEIAGDAGEYFDAKEVESVYGVIRSLLGNEERRKQLVDLGRERVKKFTWQQTVRLTEKTYRLCL